MYDASFLRLNPVSERMRRRILHRDLQAREDLKDGKYDADVA